MKIECALLTAVLCISGKLSAYTGTGDGSSGNPYQIANVGDFQQLCNTPDDWWKSFILTANIDLAGEILTPIGNESTKFTGVFDGKNYIILNAVINQPSSDFIGLFGYTGPYATIRNLGVVDANMTGNSSVGVLAGMNYYGTITDCYSSGMVSGADSNVGGLVGWNYNGSILSCHATSSVTGTSGTGSYIGGLVGLNDSETLIHFCYATGNVHGGSSVGGLVGSNDSVSLTSCYSTGAVFGHGNQIGGLAGMNTPQGIITTCYATGSITGTGYNSGGLVGSNYNIVTNCYATGAVSGYYNPGGLIGRNFGGTATACFWDTQTCLPVTAGVGSGTATGVTGKTSSQMKTLSTFTSVGWDFSHTDGDISDWIMPEANYPYLIWGMSVIVPDVVGHAQVNAETTLTQTELTFVVSGVASDTIPTGQVISQSLAPSKSVRGGTLVPIVVSLGVHYSGGGGTESDPYRISTIRDWQVLMADSTDWDKAYILTNIINLSGVIVTPVGNITTKFTGVFDGNHYRISDVSITSQPTENHIGLFGYISYGSQIKNLGVNDVNIIGGYNAAGGLVGTNDGGMLVSCYATGSVKGTHDVGGLVGRNFDGVLTACYTAVSVSGTGNYIGGLMGVNAYGTVTNCYATGAVNATDSYASHIGGLVGFNNGTLTACYAVGLVKRTVPPSSTDYIGGLLGGDNGTPTSCFWDITSSNQPTSAGGDGVQGKTTAEMMMESTYTSAGWDFSAADGDPADWVIPVSGYPQLAGRATTEEPFKIIESGGGSASGFSIRWTCKAGYSYQVKYSETLASGNWHEIGPVFTATSGQSSLSYTDTSGVGKPQRFYVVVRISL